MSELKDLLNTVDVQRKDIDDLQRVILSLNIEIDILKQDIEGIQKDAAEFQDSVSKIIKDMGFDVSRLVRDRSCRVNS